MSKSTSWIWFTASHSAVMPSFIAKVKHRHRFCSVTHRIQLRKWLASVKRADSSSTDTGWLAGRPAGLLLLAYWQWQCQWQCQWQWAVAVGVDVVTDTQTQCQLYDYRTATFHLRWVRRIGVQIASQSLRFVNIHLLPWPVRLRLSYGLLAVMLIII